MATTVSHWLSACQDCGSRKARPKAVVPLLRSVETGDVCDRWAIDVAGPLPVTASGKCYVIAAVEYTTRYAVAEAVVEHTAKAIARFLMERVVLVFGPMMEIMMDGAMEFGSQATVELLELMQTKQATPLPYRPNLLGLVERFHRTWKDIVSLYVAEGQDDWDDFVPCALYAYNSARHATHGYQPNELMMGRKLRTPAELLRRSQLTHPRRTLQDYHETLIADLRRARELAALALQKEQARQAMYYNQRKERGGREFRLNQLVWVYRPARGPGITKFGHRWRGPAQVMEAADYDNFRVKMLESGRELVVHCSFLLSYFYPTNLLDAMARDIADDLREEAIAAADIDPEESSGGAPDLEQPAVAEDSQTNTEVEAAATAPPAEGATTQAEPSSAEQDPGEQQVRDDGDTRDNGLPRGTDGRQQGQQSTSARKRAAPARAGGDPTGGANAAGPAASRRPRKRVRTIAPAADGDAVASRTRARGRRAPQPGVRASGDQGEQGGGPAGDVAEQRPGSPSGERQGEDDTQETERGESGAVGQQPRHRLTKRMMSPASTCSPDRVVEERTVWSRDDFGSRSYSQGRQLGSAAGGGTEPEPVATF
jgi:hypothetical protein